MAAENVEPESRQPRRAGTMCICAVEEIGNNSEIPCTTPRMATWPYCSEAKPISRPALHKFAKIHPPIKYFAVEDNAELICCFILLRCCSICLSMNILMNIFLSCRGSIVDVVKNAIVQRAAQRGLFHDFELSHLCLRAGSGARLCSAGIVDDRGLLPLGYANYVPRYDNN